MSMDSIDYVLHNSLEDEFLHNPIPDIVEGKTYWYIEYTVYGKVVRAVSYSEDGLFPLDKLINKYYCPYMKGDELECYPTMYDALDNLGIKMALRISHENYKLAMNKAYYEVL